MRIAYDPQTDALSMAISQQTVVRSMEPASGVILNFGAEGTLVSVDLMGVTRWLGREAIARIVIDLGRL